MGSMKIFDKVFCLCNEVLDIIKVGRVLGLNKLYYNSF